MFMIINLLLVIVLLVIILKVVTGFNKFRHSLHTLNSKTDIPLKQMEMYSDVEVKNIITSDNKQRSAMIQVSYYISNADILVKKNINVQDFINKLTDNTFRKLVKKLPQNGTTNENNNLEKKLVSKMNETTRIYGIKITQVKAKNINE